MSDEAGPSTSAPMDVDVAGPSTATTTTPTAAPATAATRKTGSSHVPWVEKHRPMRLKDVVGNEETVSRLGTIAADGNVPNFIISGPPGTGKTTSIHALCHELLGSSYKDAVLELNASDDRGINVVRNDIKMFAQKQATLPPGRHKVIILDEADSMTETAQQALRRIMEKSSNTTRFALACNQSDKIIEAIQSRCVVLRYSRLTDIQVLDRVVKICELEGVARSDDGLEAIVFTAEGDMRQAINNLQATHSGFGFVNSENVFKVCDQPHPLQTKEILNACLKADIDQSLRVLHSLWAKGYSASDIMSTLFRVVKQLEMAEHTKLSFIREIALVQMRVAEGCATVLQISALLARLCRLVV